MKVPVFVPLPAELLEIRYPRFIYQPDRMPIRDMRDKIEALELALGQCNNDKELILAKQPAAAQ